MDTCIAAQFGLSKCGVPAFPSWFYTTFLRIVVVVLISGLQQVCYLWSGVSKCMLPVKRLATKILKITTVNYCGRQLARKLEWAAPASHKKKGAITHPVVCNFSIQYDGRPDERFGVQVGTWNLDSLSGNEREVCDELRKMMIDVCCLQEVRWRGQGARMLGMKGRRYRLWCSGKGYGVGGVVVMMKEELCEKVVEIRRISYGVMSLVVFEEDVLRLIYGYAPQGGKSLEKKQSFYDELKCEWDMHSVDDSVMCLVTLMDMLVGILMDLMGYIMDIV